MGYKAIRNTQKFFEKLSASKGIVELVDRNGARLQLTQGQGRACLFPFPQIYGEIKEMELCFHCSEDCHEILSYLLNSHNQTASYMADHNVIVQ